MALKTYQVDIDFYTMEIVVKAKSKADARKKAKAKIKTKINSHINDIFIDEM